MERNTSFLTVETGHQRIKLWGHVLFLENHGSVMVMGYGILSIAELKIKHHWIRLVSMKWFFGNIIRNQGFLHEKIHMFPIDLKEDPSAPQAPLDLERGLLKQRFAMWCEEWFIRTPFGDGMMVSP